VADVIWITFETASYHPVWRKKPTIIHPMTTGFGIRPLLIDAGVGTTFQRLVGRLRNDRPPASIPWEQSAGRHRN
jgi:hypothetical protein